MKVFKLVLLTVLCSLVAALMRWAIIDRHRQPEARKTEAMAVSGPAEEVRNFVPANLRRPLDVIIPPAQITEVREPLEMVGYAIRGRRLNVWLSDGRFLTEQNPELHEVRRNFAVVSGVKIWMKGHPTGKRSASGTDAKQDRAADQKAPTPPAPSPV